MSRSVFPRWLYGKSTYFIWEEVPSPVVPRWLYGKSTYSIWREGAIHLSYRQTPTRARARRSLSVRTTASIGIIRGSPYVPRWLYGKSTYSIWRGGSIWGVPQTGHPFCTSFFDSILGPVLCLRICKSGSKNDPKKGSFLYPKVPFFIW